jgi:phosphoenolpyruvate synthase/pyruvate phosphate dikinase
MQPFTKKFKDISLADLPDVGGKNASLGEMYNKLSKEGISVPNGFAHEKVALSVGVQKMVRFDKASSGVIFTLEPESGY